MRLRSVPHRRERRKESEREKEREGGKERKKNELAFCSLYTRERLA